MNNEKLKKKVSIAIKNILAKKNYIAPVDILIEMELISIKDYEDWRLGRIPFLEKVCKTNLKKLSLVMREVRDFAKQNNLKKSKTVYKKWGKGTKDLLRFSKSGDPNIEEAYSTHFLV